MGMTKMKGWNQGGEGGGIKEVKEEESRRGRRVK